MILKLINNSLVINIHYDSLILIVILLNTKLPQHSLHNILLESSTKSFLLENISIKLILACFEKST